MQGNYSILNQVNMHVKKNNTIIAIDKQFFHTSHIFRGLIYGCRKM